MGWSSGTTTGHCHRQQSAIPPLANARDGTGLQKGVFLFRTLDDCERIMQCAATARRAAVMGEVCGAGAARGSELGLETHIVHLMPHLMEARSILAPLRCSRQFEQMGLVTHWRREPGGVGNAT